MYSLLGTRYSSRPKWYAGGSAAAEAEAEPGHSLKHGVVHQPWRSLVRSAKRDDVSNRSYPVRWKREGSPDQREKVPGTINRGAAEQIKTPEL